MLHGVGRYSHMCVLKASTKIGRGRGRGVQEDIHKAQRWMRVPFRIAFTNSSPYHSRLWVVAEIVTLA